MGKAPDQIIETPKQKLYKAGPDIHILVADLVKQFHHPLMSVVDQIVVLFKDTAPEDRIAVVAKASPKLAVLAAQPCVFTVEIGFDRWEKLSQLQQIALIDRALCAMVATQATDGSLTFKVRKPDISYFREEVIRHGFWVASKEKPDDLTLASLVDRVFGEASSPGVDAEGEGP